MIHRVLDKNHTTIKKKMIWDDLGIFGPRMKTCQETEVSYPALMIVSGERYCRVWISSEKCLAVARLGQRGNSVKQTGSAEC